MAGAQESLSLVGTMRGHNGEVTAIATPIDNSPFIVSSSRDKSVLVWDLTNPVHSTPESGAAADYGVPFRRLTGHSHFVQDVVLSSDGQFALSGSWDGELRLWDLSTGLTTRRFVGHEKDVISVAFSVDNRQIVSASRDKTIKLWNTLGECKYTIGGDHGGGEGHNGWVSCVRFSPNTFQPTIVSGSWDRTVKVWNLTNCKLRSTLDGHGGYVNAVAVSPDGSLCASGGKDGFTLLWDLTEGKRLYSLDAGSIIHSLCFSPNRYWLCAATQDSVKIWDLESKHVVQDLKPDIQISKNQILYCTSLSWSADGSTLYTGYTDGSIRVREHPSLAGRVDVRFVFCNVTSPDDAVFVALEIMRYGDIIVLDCAENMDNGKTYTFFSTVARAFNATRYDYVMKADDDTYLRLPALAASLRGAAREDAYFGLQMPCDRENFYPFPPFMSGMGYALSWDLVAWVAASDLARREQDGPEDMWTGRWFNLAGKAKNRYDQAPRMYNYKGASPDSCFRHGFVPDTIAVHMLKDDARWAETLAYFNATARSGQLYHLPPPAGGRP
ncbi:uncharacterized protein C2845_PM06G01450 [Panicum miliaceum]|uniref:Uncharacterized protein n=1 Tax=Panicum miliaceum TaxID=4540 RepID=A0A3L6R8M1_PANMI|nr:uncharacterized protein C2845_PM06G01450 [Panicum miliaceum]